MKNLKIGVTTNLIYGYNASWLSKESGNNALFPVEKLALKETVVIKPKTIGKWSFPEITLHDSAVSLLNTLLPYKVKNPSDGTKAAILPSGNLILPKQNGTDELKHLSDTLGVDLSVENCGFALIQLKRIDTSVAHPTNQDNLLIHPNPLKIPAEFGVTKEFTRAVASLKRVKPRGIAFKPDAVKADDANAYLDFYTDFGTHFVSKITLGDVIFQVLVMPQERYERVKKIYTNNMNKLSGEQAILFRQYTTNHRTGAFGYVQEYGNILSFSQSNTLTTDIKQGAWIEDVFAETNSVFALYDNGSKISNEILNSKYNDYTSIETDLTSLTLFLEHSRKQIWRRVFKAGVIQKFQKAIEPEFVEYCNCDLADRLKQNELPGFLSNIATPEINIYKASIDISTLEFVAPDKVRNFTLYSNYLHQVQNKTVVIPGNNVLLSFQLVTLENQNFVTAIELSDKAFEDFSLFSQHFYGALLVKNSSDTEHVTIVDGLKYISNTATPNGKAYVRVVDDVRRAPEEQYLPKLKSSLHFNYSFSEAQINTLSSEIDDAMMNFLRQSLLWITQIIPVNTKDVDLLDLRVRALNQAYIGKDSSLGSFVPILPFTDYKSYIEHILAYIDEINTNIDKYHAQIESRKAQELFFGVAKDLNKNIIDSGKLLSGYIDTSISQQQSLSGYYDSIIKQKKSEQQEQEAAVIDLWTQVNFTQQSEVAAAVTNYKQALKDWKTREEIKFGLAVATDLFSSGAAIVVPTSSISAVKNLGSLVVRIQNLQKVLNGTYEMFEDSKAGVSKLQAAQKTFDGIDNVLTANLNWDELSINFDEVLAIGPSDPNVNREKVALVAAFKIYILKGKAYTLAKYNLQQIAAEIYNQQRQQDLINEQVKRLEKLNTHLHPKTIKELDVSKIDLIGLTGSLSLVRSQMLGTLSKTFALKDQVLRYTYLQDPTIIPSFDMLGIRRALVTQEGNTITAKTKLAQYQTMTTTPIDVEVEIASEDLRNGNIYQFNLPANIPEFYKYVDVRVKAVVAKVDGIKATDSGSYLLDLCYDGKPFVDRSIDRDQILFNTISRNRTYEYEVNGNKPKFADKGETWSEGVNPITPFSIWEISLPKTKTNKGIIFEGLTTKITLSFVLTTRIHDAKKLLLESNMMLAKSGPVKPPIDTLIGQMAGKSVLNDWDVVFNMSLSQINRVLKLQYDELKKNDKDYGGRIIANSITLGRKIGDLQGFDLMKFNMNYGYPELQFLTNDPNTGKLDMQIISGTVQKGSRYVGNNNSNDKKNLILLAEMNNLTPDDVKNETIDGEDKLVLTYYNEAEPLKTTARLHAAIKISQIKGLVDSNDNILSVSLDMSKGTFAAKDIEIDMSDAEKIAFSDAVKNYFVEHSVNFIINSLDLSGITTLADLKPHQFLFKAFETHSGNKMLQLFIQTNNRTTINRSSQTFINSDVPEPIPEGSETSLMISSKIFFGSVLPESIQGDWSLSGVEPNDPSKSWSSKFTKAYAPINVDLSFLNVPPPGLYISKHYPISHFSDLEEMSIKPYSSPNAYMKLDLNGDPGQARQSIFNYKVEIYEYYDGDGKYVYQETKTSSTNYLLKVSSSLHLELTGDGRKQNIKLIAQKDSVSVDAKTSGGGACHSDDPTSQINEQLNNVLPKQLDDNLDISFDDISIFALKNLLFPSNNYINLKGVYMPGDLLIVGDFVKDKES